LVDDRDDLLALRLGITQCRQSLGGFARLRDEHRRTPARSARENLAALAAALNETMTVTENGKRRQVTKREAVIAQLVNKSASAELRATKMLIDMLRDIERKRIRQRPTKTRSARPTRRWSNS
jgi:hypothetical protein